MEGLLNKRTNYKLLPFVNKQPLLPIDGSVLISDLDVDVSKIRAGITFLYVANSVNPKGAPAGIWFHVQRLSNNVTTSQYVYQFTIKDSKLYYRTGSGNNERIIWDNIIILPNS